MAPAQRSTQMESKSRIVEAAIIEVLNEGILGLRVQEVAIRAGVSVPLVYKYFVDRNGLLAEALGTLFERRSFEHIERANELFASIVNPTVDDFISLLVLPSQEFRRVRRWMNIQIFAASLEIPALRDKMIDVEKRMNAEIVRLVEEMNEMLGQTVVFPKKAVAVLTRSIQLGMVHNDLLDEDGAMDEDFMQLWRMILSPTSLRLDQPRQG